MKRIAFSVLLVALVSCGDDDTPEGCDYFVSPGTDDQTAIQSAFIEATDGQTVCLDEGTFALTDPVEISGRTDFTLRGAGANASILDFSGQTVGGAGVDMMNMNRLVVEDLAILDARGNGLRINSSTDLVIRNVRAGWTNESDVNNGKYAIYPVASTNVLIEESEAFNSSDAGIYVGQVDHCLVRNNVAHGNVAGIEIENSTDCEVLENTAEDNTAGILVFELPGLPTTGGGTLVHDNIARNNNRENFGDPSSAVGLAPTGSGIFILAANDVEIRDNTIENNRSLGVAVVSYSTILALDMSPAPEGYDPFANDIHIHDNTFTNNGDMPGTNVTDVGPDALLMLLGAIDAFGGVTLTTLENVVWDGFTPPGSGPMELCLGDAPTVTFRNLNVPRLGEDDYESPTDVTPHACSLPPRTEVTLAFHGQ